MPRSIRAMVLGLKDYVNKNRFPGVVLGLSGGIDSALTAAVAVDALGADRVRCVMMPSRYTSQDSLEDASRGREAAWACSSTSIPIEAAGRGVRRDAGADCSRAGSPTSTEENIQSRIRGADPDGDLEQVRPDGADHRQQVRDVGRLRHALWRHVRRLQRAQGSLQDAGLRAVALAQPAHAQGRARARRAASCPSA